MKARRLVVACTLIVAAISPAGSGQDPGPEPDRKEAERKVALGRARDMLVAAKVDPDKLERDLRLIEENFPRIEAATREQGFREEDATGAAISIWLYVRYPRKEAGDGPAKVGEMADHFEELSRDEQVELFLRAPSVMGKLTVSSMPSDAAVEVDGILWDEKTNVSRFVPEGEHEIVVSKKGSKDRGKVTVKKRKETKYDAVLK